MSQTPWALILTSVVAGCTNKPNGAAAAVDAGLFGAPSSADAAAEGPAKSTIRGAPPAVCPAGMNPLPGGTYAARRKFGEAPIAIVVSPFCLDVTEVTVEAYATCLHAKGCTDTKPDKEGVCNLGHPGSKNHPMNCVTWPQANAYCAWEGERLPSEDEWEWAARGLDRDLAYPWGNDAPGPTLLNACDQECIRWREAAFPGELTSAAIYPQSDGWPNTAPVGSFPKGRSPLGFLDLAGNVDEWTASDYGGLYKDNKAVRGGAWTGHDARRFGLKTDRHENGPNGEGWDIGFRCAK